MRRRIAESNTMSVQSRPIQIRPVWSDNLEYEIELISSVVDFYSVISMDTEFPGVVFRPPDADEYTIVKANVDRLNLIQLGLALSDEKGNLPDFGTGSFYIWEFNFRDFDLARHDYNPDSIEMLRQQGINFEENRHRGVDTVRFGELIMSSGLICNDSLTWVTFHCSHDFAYLVKTLTGRYLPHRLDEFLELVRVFFGNRVFDVKHLTRFSDLFGGLSRVCEILGVKRLVGKSHQAGSDCLLTLHAFLVIRKLYLSKDGLLEKCANVLYGLEPDKCLLSTGFEF